MRASSHETSREIDEFRVHSSRQKAGKYMTNNMTQQRNCFVYQKQELVNIGVVIWSTIRLIRNIFEVI